MLRRISTNQQWRREQHLRYARLYSNAPLIGLGVPISRVQLNGSGRLAYNVVKSCTDTLVAELAEDRPNVKVVTSGGDHDLQTRAEQLEAFLDGTFYEGRLYEERTKYLTDACIFGTGCLKIFRDGQGEFSRVAYERVLPWELIVDEQEALYGAPRSLYQRKLVDRAVLRALFPDHARAIDQATRATDDVWTAAIPDSTADQLLVVEAWHLRSGPAAKDGRHVICIDGTTLIDETWDRDTFPFVFYRRQPPPFGYWGIGVAEELQGIQLEINILLSKIQRAHHLLGGSHWMVEAGSKVAQGTLDNDLGSVIRYTGTPPQVYTPSAVSGDTYQHLETLFHKAFALTGIPEASARGSVPSQFQSGEAQRVYADLKSKRFNVAVRADHDCMVEIARQTIEIARQISADYPEFATKSFATKQLRRVRFLDADMTEKDATLQMFPANSLAKEPAARLQQVQDLANAGWIEPQDAKRLLGFPDLQAAQSYADASYNVTMMMIDAALKEGRYVGPEPYMDLADAQRRVQLAYLDAKLRGVDEDRLQILRDWLEACASLMQPPPPPDQNGPPPGGPTEAPPGMAPPPEGPPLQ